ncbi:MAG: hybrid sensor histidine kinase/response regulator [Planctomycetota bacterium]
MNSRLLLDPSAQACSSAAALDPGVNAPTIRVIALDDDPADIEAVRRCLRSVDSLETHLTGCASIKAADELLQRESFDLLFVDYYLTGTTGPEALRHLQSVGHQLPSVLLTDGTGQDMLHEALRAGVIDYLVKDALTPQLMEQTILNALKKAELRAEIGRKHVQLQQTVARLRRRQHEIEEFFHSVSHELKMPLTGAKELISLVAEGIAGDVNYAQSKLLSSAIRNCDQMGHCVNDMLDAARIETGKLLLNPERTDLVTVLSDALDSIRVQVNDKGIKVRTRGMDRPLFCVLDPHRIFQVAANLAANAAKFTPDGGLIEMYLERLPQGAASITVSDSGPGVPSGDELRVFDRLYQSHNEDAAVLGGLGMGLYICHQIVELHGGRIACRRSDLGGAEFTFVLPHPCGEVT